MAEGGDLTKTLKGGSESLFEHACSQCRDDGRAQEATNFCQECKQFLCNTCGRYHVRNMKTHTLLSIASMTQTKTSPAITGPIIAKCRYHPDRDIEMFCGNHDMVFCKLCVDQQHRSCRNVFEVKDMAHSTKLSTLHQLEADITKVTKRLQDTKFDKMNDFKLIKKKKASLLQQIIAVRKRMNAQLDALEQKLIAELDVEETKLENEINTAINSADALMTANNQHKPVIGTCLLNDSDVNQIFVIEKLAGAVLKEAYDFLKSENLSKRPTLIFEQNDSLCKTIEQSKRIGVILNDDSTIQHTQSKTHKVESVCDINARVMSDRYHCIIDDICQLPSGTILLTDLDNKKLKILDDQLQVTRWLDLEGTPCGLFVMSPTKVAVRLQEETIYTLNVRKSLSYSKVFLSSTPYWFNNGQSGLVCCNNRWWIPNWDGVLVFSLSGTLVIEISRYGGASCIAVSNDDTKVFLVEASGKVVVLNYNGDFICKLRKARNNRTLVDACICTTDDDSTLVAEYNSWNVVMFRGDGTQSELISRKDMIACLRSLCYDRKRNCLLVGYVSDIVRVFKLSN